MPYPDHDAQAAEDLAEGLRKLRVETLDLGRALIPGGSPTTRYKAAKRILDGERDTPFSRVVTMTKGLPVRVIIEGGVVRVERVE